MLVYFAGPDIFYPDYQQWKQQVKSLADHYDIQPLFPGDDDPQSSPHEIFRANIELIERADGIIANLNPFRGQEADSGTSFEIGYAFSRQKIVIAILGDTRPMIEKINDDLASVENFGYPCNLMLAAAAREIVSDMRNAMRLIEYHYYAERPDNGSGLVSPAFITQPRPRRRPRM